MSFILTGLVLVASLIVVTAWSSAKGSPLATIWNMVAKAAPSAPDGRADAVQSDAKSSIFHDLIHLGGKNTRTMVQAFNTIAAGEPLDDKKWLLEHGVSMLQSLPRNSGLSSKVSGGFIKMLWRDLPHPPAALAGPENRYRRHDGGNNNHWDPEMGKAGSPYCRSVPPVKAKGPNLPDPELVFEKLLKRKGAFRPHPSGLNRLFFSFATVVIHECFQTSRDKQWINETSSYVDLSTLYGNTIDQQKHIRTHQNGLIHPDAIASERIMLMPPGVIAVLIMFSRNHNEIAYSLWSVNEDGKYGDWDELSPEKQREQDEDIFQLARNINVGFFASVVLKDYVAAILNTPRANSEWSLDLGGEIKLRGDRVERGAGNVVSVEFAVLYHWHAALSSADATWMEEIIRKNIPDLKSLDDMTPDLFKKLMHQEGGRLFSMPRKEWTFGGLKRGPDGRFSDTDLGKIIKDCIEEPAHAFGAHGTPASLKVVDIMGQLQARNVFNVCSMNEFRKYLNLKPYENFMSWCEDEETARAAELLYGHIDNLELYPGLQAECTKQPMPGSGVCPGQTTGRGILDDAVSLVRGDRFLSHDMNSSTLTNWGMSKLGSSVAAGSYGGVLPTLLFAGLPGEFTGTSLYALLPFYTPAAAQGIVQGNGALDKYDTERPATNATKIIGIHTHDGCKQVFSDRDTFRVMYQAAIRNCTDNHDFMIGWDNAHRHDERSAILHKVFFEQDFEANVSSFFRSTVRSLIETSSLAYAGSRRSINIVRDVCNVTPILWLAERFAIPLKTSKNPRGLITRAELFDLYLVLFMYQSFNILPQNEWKLREASMKVAPLLRGILHAHLSTQTGGLKETFTDFVEKGTAYEVGPDADRLYKSLAASGLPYGDLVGDCIGMAAPVAGNLTQQASLLIDLYLSPGYEKYKARIIELSHRPDHDKDAQRELLGFVYEGMRHAGVVPGLPRVATRDVVLQDGQRGSIRIKADQTVLIATSRAAMDPAAFPRPELLDPHRPISSYILLGHGLHFCFGARLVAPALVSTLKEVFRLRNLRRATGRQGNFSTLMHHVAGVNMRVYLDEQSRESPIPTTLTLIYDAEDEHAI
ncbi:Psi-producing oxygenase A [Cyphellophora attinorum]|uniref:Psi-producing oxygenase A n=1 Tax=Cyphellophora attinorum TaxID=1664694 RepID=A0A0N1HSW3_9EURO|nr:Psi-producing oxygenase A [Phialophora attinorum]KPI39432.1 Psi-producing oxygenase A [Phialophora attinorum]